MTTPTFESSRRALHIVWNRAGSELDELLERFSGDLSGRQVVIDCRHKLTLRSAEVSKLIQLRRRLLAHDCTLRIQQVMPDALEILHLTRLDRIFEIHPATEL